MMMSSRVALVLMAVKASQCMLKWAWFCTLPSTSRQAVFQKDNIPPGPVVPGLARVIRASWVELIYLMLGTITSISIYYAELTCV